MELLIVTIFCIITSGFFLWFALNYNIFKVPARFTFPRILMYHSVEDAIPSGMNISPAKLEKHILKLKKENWKFYRISEIFHLKDKKRIAITLDDGFENNYTHLFPLLRKYNIPATIYVAPNIQNIKKLSDRQIQEMLNSGLVEIGSHTMNHINLTKLNPDEARREMLDSKKYIEEKYATKCESLAYPFGRFNETIASIAQEIGYKYALTTKKKVADFKNHTNFTIPRISIGGKINSLQFIAAILNGRYKF